MVMCQCFRALKYAAGYELKCGVTCHRDVSKLLVHQICDTLITLHYYKTSGENKG